MKKLPMIVGIMLGTLLGCNAAGPFSGVKEIRLSRGVPNSPTAETVTINEAAKINEFLATITLQKKNSCACLHLESAVFVKAEGEIKVSLCEHCFNFDGKTYAMPAGFYPLFQRAFPSTPGKSTPPTAPTAREKVFPRSPIIVAPADGEQAPKAGESPPAATDWLDLLADEDSYKSEPGRETVFRGKLEAVPQADGFTTLQRTSYYKLGDRTVHTAARKMEALDRLVGQVVEIHGKAVDMELEGKNLKEIWPAAVRPAR